LELSCNNQSKIINENGTPLPNAWQDRALYEFKFERFNPCKVRLLEACPCAIVDCVIKTSVMSSRLAHKVKRRFGQNTSQVGARLVEDGLRRRDFPQIELRETVAGRVGYLAGTRFAVYWIARVIGRGMTPEVFAKEYELPVKRVRATMAYAVAFPDEIESDIALAEANRQRLESQQAADFVSRKTRKQRTLNKCRKSTT